MTKFLSVLTGVGLGYIGLSSLTANTSVMFLFFSNNKAVIVGKILLGTFTIFLSFKKTISYRLTYQLTTVLCLLLILLPLAGIFYQPLTYSIYSVVKPLDYLISLVLGITLAICLIEAPLLNKPLNVRLPNLPALPSKVEIEYFIFNWMLRSNPVNKRVKHS